jgi:hypothetical protein
MVLTSGWRWARVLVSYEHGNELWVYLLKKPYGSWCYCTISRESVDFFSSYVSVPYIWSDSRQYWCLKVPVLVWIVLTALLNVMEMCKWNIQFLSRNFRICVMSILFNMDQHFKCCMYFFNAVCNFASERIVICKEILVYRCGCLPLMWSWSRITEN